MIYYTLCRWQFIWVEAQNAIRRPGPAHGHEAVQGQGVHLQGIIYRVKYYKHRNKILPYFIHRFINKRRSWSKFFIPGYFVQVEEFITERPVRDRGVVVGGGQVMARLKWLDGPSGVMTNFRQSIGRRSRCKSTVLQTSKNNLKYWRKICRESEITHMYINTYAFNSQTV